MRQEQNNIFLGIDWLLVFFFIILVGFGWINIFAATYSEESIQIFDFSTKYSKQLLWILLSIPLIILILFINAKFFQQFASIFFILSLFSLIGLFFFGTEINGAKSWYRFGSIGIQPSEFAKAFTALALAKLLSDRRNHLKDLKKKISTAFLLSAKIVSAYDLPIYQSTIAHKSHCRPKSEEIFKSG